MKLRLRRHETRQTLKLQLTGTSTLHDLRRQINASAPTSVHFSLNRKDELLASSPEDTLRSLGVTSGDLIYFSLDPYAFVASVEGMEGEETIHVEKLDVEVAVAASGGSKRVTEPFFLKKILLEKSGDTSELTTLAMSVHAVMLESGFVLFNPGCSDKFSFSKELLTVSLRYTLPELMTRNDDTKTTMESVTVRFQSLSDKVVVYGSLGGKVHRFYLDKRRFVPVIDLVMDTLKSDKEGSSSIYREMFMFWRMVKDGLVIPLLIGLCDKSGLELPPCLMRLPTELKLKILESLPGASVAKMACVCTEIRYLASDNDLWKHKCLEEAKHLVVNGSGDSVNWKAKFAAFWRQHHRQVSTARQTLRNFVMHRNRFPFPRIIRDPDPFGLFNGDNLHGSVGIHPGQPARWLGGRGWGRGFSPRCNLGGNN